MAAASQEAKKQNTIQFIEATKEMMDTEGIESLSIRKIAEKAGFHNSTIYLYFDDMEQLIMLASVKYLDEYSKAISVMNMKPSSVIEDFYTVWRYFSETVFDRPRIFYNFFFGKYSDNLREIITRYYELFPEERNEYTKEIEEMFYATDIRERCRIFLKPLIKEEHSCVKTENVELINEIIVCCLKSLLEEKCQNPGAEAESYIRKLLDMIQYIIKV